MEFSTNYGSNELYRIVINKIDFMFIKKCDNIKL